ncbi:MAG: hypothetical protein ACJA0U_000842 [Salibacteraceae bacterium]|jgi:hypothetical protein
MKQILVVLLACISYGSMAQLDGNTTLSYPDLIKTYKQLAENHDEIELYEMGESDFGLPIYVCVLNVNGDSLKTFEKARKSTTLLINNAIHPGEPDGVNACLIWINAWIKNGKSKDIPVIGIIPAYNVGGMMNRSGTSRANQDGPEEYGFRGNAQNLDLNRDFIKMDSKNMFTFAKIYHALDPDVFIDTHVSNGADYQYTMTYIASVKERMAPSLAKLMHDVMIPKLKEVSSSKGFDLIPYVNLKDEVPENGMEVFNDLPRYAMGYASLMNAISFTTETHMLKSFPERVKSTRIFIEATIEWMQTNSKAIEKAREEAREWEQKLDYYPYNFEIVDEPVSILFKGYEYSRPKSEVTGLERLKYHRDRPYEKEILYYDKYAASDSIQIPDVYFVGAQCTDVIERLAANNIEYTVLGKGFKERFNNQRIVGLSKGKSPYEGHFLHSDVEMEMGADVWGLKEGDVMILTHQLNRRFIASVLEPETPDSYFAWNFFDSYLQQKEYFSAYVFEDKALEILNANPHLKKEFEIKKSTDEAFAESSWQQLHFIYQHSDYYEPTHNVLPVGSRYEK